MDSVAITVHAPQCSSHPFSDKRIARRDNFDARWDHQSPSLDTLAGSGPPSALIFVPRYDDMYDFLTWQRYLVRSFATSQKCARNNLIKSNTSRNFVIEMIRFGQFPNGKRKKLLEIHLSQQRQKLQKNCTICHFCSFRVAEGR